MGGKAGSRVGMLEDGARKVKLKAELCSSSIERDVGQSERKIEKIQREFREFEEQLVFSAAE